MSLAICIFMTKTNEQPETKQTQDFLARSAALIGAAYPQGGFTPDFEL
jgi:hypothetical protein